MVSQNELIQNKLIIKRSYGLYRCCQIYINKCETHNEFFYFLLLSQEKNLYHAAKRVSKLL